MLRCGRCAKLKKAVQTVTYCMSLFIWNVQKGKSVETESGLVVGWGWWWKQRVIARRHVGSFWGDGICSTIGWWGHEWILWHVNYTSINLLSYHVPETLLHSCTNSLPHEGRLPSQAALVFLGGPSLQALETWEVWSSLLPCTYVHVISYFEGYLLFYKRNHSNFL